jgi:hypothetical protein
MRSEFWVFALVTIAFAAELGAQSPPLSPAYALGSGPRVSIDRAHFNLHTMEGLYRPFAELLARDGYVLQGNAEPFSEESLARTNVLVISNALGGPLSDEVIRRLPARSAFLDAEIEAVYRWVSEGGSLLLIADHMPFPGAVEKLAMRFGIFVHNGYAGTRGAPNPLVFALSAKSLRDHPITRGRSNAERVPFVATFGGHAFRLHSDLDASPLMVFAPESTVYLTEEMLSGQGTITPQTPRIPADGLFQGAALKIGTGKVFMSGEAAMFSAQVAPDGSPYGFNNPGAPHNAQFVLNVLHWLSGILDEDSPPAQ